MAPFGFLWGSVSLWQEIYGDSHNDRRGASFFPGIAS